MDKSHAPTLQEIQAVLGTTYPLWEKLTRFIAENYPIPVEWNSGGKTYGWNIWYRKSGKTLTTLFPEQGYFIAQVVLGKVQVEQALQLELGENVGRLLRETPQYHDGRWLFIPVRSERDVADVQQLLQVKRKPKPVKSKTHYEEEM